MVSPIISLIVPVLNEEAVIGDFLRQFPTNENLEIVIVDGGSQDSTQEIVRDFSQKCNQIQLLCAAQVGRAKQMNYGAMSASGKFLLFLHADTIVPRNFLEIIENVLVEKSNILGAFQLRIGDSARSLRLIEKITNWRSHWFSLPYGDQGLFITKANFDLLNGFRELPIMEDFDLVTRARKKGKVVVVKKSVLTSARRWQKIGIFQTTLINQIMILGYYLKVSPHTLERIYARKY